MKNFLFLVFFSVLLSSNTKASSTTAVVDCASFATAYVAVIEEYFGCLDSDAYNNAYNTVKSNCEKM